MRRCVGFADLTFSTSAGLAFARALEGAETDVPSDLRDAWVIEDRRITFSIHKEISRSFISGLKRLLSALVSEAESGEAVLEVAGPRVVWAERALFSGERPIHSGSDTIPGGRPPDAPHAFAEEDETAVSRIARTRRGEGMHTADWEVPQRA